MFNISHIEKYTILRTNYSQYHLHSKKCKNNRNQSCNSGSTASPSNLFIIVVTTTSSSS